MSNFLTTQQAAKELGVTIRRVQALIGAGRLRADLFGRVWMIPRAALASVRERPAGRPRNKDKASSKR